MRRIGPNGALLLASPPEHLRNGDTHFKFRQDSDILYLTGFEEPGAVRGAAARARGDALRDVRAPARSGRGDLDGAARRRRGRRARLRRGRGVRRPASWTASWPRSWRARTRSTIPFGREPALDAAVARLLGRLRVAERRGTRAPLRLVDARLTLHEMRLIKSPEEVAIQRRAAEITAEAHIAAMLARARRRRASTRSRR